jgi:hypothetical protein
MTALVEQHKKPVSGQNAGRFWARNLGGRYRGLHLVFSVCQKVAYSGVCPLEFMRWEDIWTAFSDRIPPQETQRTARKSAKPFDFQNVHLGDMLSTDKLPHRFFLLQWTIYSRTKSRND